VPPRSLVEAVSGTAPYTKGRVFPLQYRGRDKRKPTKAWKEVIYTVVCLCERELSPQKGLLWTNLALTNVVYFTVQKYLKNEIVWAGKYSGKRKSWTRTGPYSAVFDHLSASFNKSTEDCSLRFLCLCPASFAAYIGGKTDIPERLFTGTLDFCSWRSSNTVSMW